MSPWTPELIERLRALWDARQTAVEIGRELGITKGSVIGKAHRLHLTARANPTRRLPHAGYAFTSVRPKGSRKPSAVGAVVTAQAGTISRGWEAPLSKRTTCQWIPRESPCRDEFKCGAPAIIGQAWCPQCRARVYAPARPPVANTYISSRRRSE